MVLGLSCDLVAALFDAWLLSLIGTNELAAYSFTFPVVSTAWAVQLGLYIGMSSVLARAVGTDGQEGARLIATCGLLLTTATMLLTSAVGLLTNIYIFMAMGATGETLQLATEYMTLWYASLIFFTLPFASVSALRALGDARLSGYILVGGAAMQMLLSPFFILGLLGLPQLGVTGAAVALTISRILLCFLTFHILLSRVELREQVFTIRGLTVRAITNICTRILTIGIPAMATNLIGPVSIAIIVRLLADHGITAVAGFGIASRLESISVIPLLALSASIGPFVGQNWGANRPDRANQAMRTSFLWSFLWGLFIALLFATAGGWMISLFNVDPEAQGYAGLYLWMVPISYGAWGTLMMVSAVFNALGRPLHSTCLALIRMFGIYVPFALVGDQLFGVVGIFGATALANLLTGIIGYVWNRLTYARVAAPSAVSEKPASG